MSTYDLSVSDKERYGSPEPTSINGNKKEYPTIEVLTKQVPLESLDLGDTFSAMTKYRVKRLDKDEKRISYRLEVIEMKFNTPADFFKLSPEDQVKIMKKQVLGK